MLKKLNQNTNSVKLNSKYGHWQKISKKIPILTGKAFKFLGLSIETGNQVNCTIGRDSHIFVSDLLRGIIGNHKPQKII